jgi:hypothetical protein
VLAADTTSTGAVIIACAAVLPATIASITGLVVALRARTENREAHAAVVHALHQTAQPVAKALGVELPEEEVAS